MSHKKDNTNSGIWISLSKLPLPEEIFGICKNSRSRAKVRCEIVKAVLGDGYCQYCWDLGYPKKKKRRVTPIDKKHQAWLTQKHESAIRARSGNEK